MSEPTPMKRACEIVHPGIGIAPRLDGGPPAPRTREGEGKVIRPIDRLPPKAKKGRAES